MVVAGEFFGNKLCNICIHWSDQVVILNVIKHGLRVTLYKAAVFFSSWKLAIIFSRKKTINMPAAAFTTPAFEFWRFFPYYYTIGGAVFGEHVRSSSTIRSLFLPLFPSILKLWDSFSLLSLLYHYKVDVNYGKQRFILRGFFFLSFLRRISTTYLRCIRRPITLKSSAQPIQWYLYVPFSMFMLSRSHLFK